MIFLTNLTGHANLSSGRVSFARFAVHARRLNPVLCASFPLAATLARTSSRSHLRWWRQAQPPVTRPRVMPLIVPRTQIAA